MRYITSLSGSKNTSVKVEKWKNLRFPCLNRLFLFFHIWRLIFLEPQRLQRCYVPHLKGLISGNLEPRAQGCDSILPSAIPFWKRPFYTYKRLAFNLFFAQLYLLNLYQTWLLDWYCCYARWRDRDPRGFRGCEIYILPHSIRRDCPCCCSLW